MKSKQILEKLTTYCDEVRVKGFSKDSFHFPVDSNSIEDADLQKACSKVSTLFEMMNEACIFSEQLAKGNLQVSAARNNVFAMPMKSLQANLSHLTWQVNQVAEGDLNQQVYFLGEFSESFNHMIESLNEKQVLEQRLQVITNILEEGLFYVDNTGSVLFANPEVLKLLEYSSDEIIGKKAANLINKPSIGKKKLLDSILNGEKYDLKDSLLIGKSGKTTAVSISARPVYKNDVLDGTVISIRNISKEKQYLNSLETINKLLEKQATTDALTGIFNRMKFDETLSAEIQRSKRSKTPLSLIICDIDHFKQVNDLFGHQAGDAVLKNLSKLIKDNIRSIDFFARWGGEEFVILTPGTNIEGAARLAEKLRKKVESNKFNNPEHITLSFGIASFSPGDSALKLINRADEAMYQAKKNGRNQVQISN